MKKYRIRPIYDDLLGPGYELVRVRWFWVSHVDYAWLKYDAGAKKTLRNIAKHLGGDAA